MLANIVYVYMWVVNYLILLFIFVDFPPKAFAWNITVAYCSDLVPSEMLSPKHTHTYDCVSPKITYKVHRDEYPVSLIICLRCWIYDDIFVHTHTYVIILINVLIHVFINWSKSIYTSVLETCNISWYFSFGDWYVAELWNWMYSPLWDQVSHLRKIRVINLKAAFISLTFR